MQRQGIEGEDIREFGTFQGGECGKESAKIRHAGEETLRTQRVWERFGAESRFPSPTWARSEKKSEVTVHWKQTDPVREA